MRISLLSLLLIAGLGAVACNRHERNEPAAREAGREAYHASQEVKKGAKEAARDLHNAGREFREGWTEARHEDPKRHEPRKDKDKD